MRKERRKKLHQKPPTRATVQRQTHLAFSILRKERRKTCIVLGLCCYIMLLSVTALTHEHTAHSQHSHSEDTCIVCFQNSQHVGIEIGSFALASPSPCSATLLLYEAVFLPLRLPPNTRSRAPPVFSKELANLYRTLCDGGSICPCFAGVTYQPVCNCPLASWTACTLLLWHTYTSSLNQVVSD